MWVALLAGLSVLCMVGWMVGGKVDRRAAMRAAMRAGLMAGQRACCWAGYLTGTSVGLLVDPMAVK